jgi:hypothetical protein
VDIAKILEIDLDEGEIWKAWYSFVTGPASVPQPLRKVRPATASLLGDLSATPSDAPLLQPRILDTQLRGCSLTFLRSLKEFLPIVGYGHWSLDNILVEVSLQTDPANSESKHILAQEAWCLPVPLTLEALAGRVLSKWEEWRGSDGYLYSLLQTPIESTPKTRLYKAWIHGLGEPMWREWAMARAEWLALEILLAHSTAKQSPKPYLQRASGCHSGSPHLEPQSKGKVGLGGYRKNPRHRP